MSEQLSFGDDAPRPGERCDRCGHVVPMPLSGLDERPRSHRDGPATEKAAALRAWPEAGSARMKIIEALRRAGASGRTFDELERMGDDGKPMYSAQKRLSDLKKGGWAEDTGMTRPTRTGAQAGVYVLSERALDYLAKQRIAELRDQQAGW